MLLQVVSEPAWENIASNEDYKAVLEYWKSLTLTSNHVAVREKVLQETSLSKL